jgi:tetratricopeptide (TPR) repeat protein
MYYLIFFVLGFFFMVNLKSKDDGIKDQWSLKEKINQNSLEKQLVASTKLKDKEFPNIHFTLNMVCSDGDLILVIKSNSSKIVDGNYEVLEFDLDWSSGFVFPGDNSRGSTITTRNGNSIINYGVYNYDFTDSNRKWYSNVIYMNVDHTLPSGIGQNAPIVINSNPKTKAFMSLGLGFQSEHLVDYQTDKFFTSNEWYIKLPTVKGTPIIKIDLNSQSLKKIYDDCKWKPAFTQTIVSDSNVHSLSTTEIDKRSVIDQEVVYQNDIEENFIREQEKKEEISDSNKSKDAISNNKIAKNENIKTAGDLLMKILDYSQENGGLDYEVQIQHLKQEIEALPKPEKQNKKEARQKDEKGVALVNAGDFDGAASMFEEAHNFNKGDVEILNNLGFTYLKLGRLEDAEKTIIETLSINPSRAIAWGTLGDVFAQKGDINRAVACFSNNLRFSKNKLKTIHSFKKWNENEESLNLIKARKNFIDWAELHLVDIDIND